MFNDLKYNSELKKLNKKKKEYQDSYSKDIIKARQQKKPHDEIEMIKQEEYNEVGMIQEEIDILNANYWRNKAYTLFVPLPEYDDEKMWTKCSMISQQNVLTPLGINTIRTAIRKEQDERSKLYWRWARFIVISLPGIIGAITGLIAVLKR